MTRSVKIETKLLLMISLGFISFTVIGTLSHELGHIFVAKCLGYRTELHYASMNYFPIQGDSAVPDSDRLPITLGGPLQTLLTAFVGFFLLLKRRESIKSTGLKQWDYLYIFLSLFCLREVFNLIMSLTHESLSPDGTYFGGDELKISVLMGLWPGTFPILFALIGLLISACVVFRIIPFEKRFTFIPGGLLGGVLGYVLWMEFAGPVLMP